MNNEKNAECKYIFLLGKQMLKFKYQNFEYVDFKVKLLNNAIYLLD